MSALHGQGWVTDGMDRCCVGFLGRHLVKHWGEFDVKLAHVVGIHSKDDNMGAQLITAACL